MAYSRENLVAALEGARAAIYNKDKEATKECLGDFVNAWNEDMTSAQFYDKDLLREFVGLVEDFFADTNVIASKKNIEILKLLPESSVQKIASKIEVKEDDAKEFEDYIDWLDRNKNYTILLHLAGVYPKSFSKIEDIILSQRGDFSLVLEFLKTYKTKANVEKILRESREYVSLVAHTKTNRKKYEKITPIWSDIFDLGKELMQENKNSRSA